MDLLRTDSNWEVRTPAKLNLLLEILSRRGDGFHEIETLMVPIRLFDSLELRSNSTGQIELECQWATPGAKAAPAGRSPSPLKDIAGGAGNIVYRAVKLLRDRSGVQAGATMRLVKRIPVAAGLGGGSSDAAAALAAANAAWNLNWSTQQLLGLAAELGSDVPFFMGSARGHGAAICRGRGEQIQRLAGLGQLHFVLAKPTQGLSTADVYAALRPPMASRAAQSASRLGAMIAALRRGATAVAAGLLHNRLQTAAESLS
ncbi:MAG: 4-(cytidine 5'-diphospho)-2-C-methyl-D-erythritol kinase, partial [Thermoguttaceae bacterium]